MIAALLFWLFSGLSRGRRELRRLRQGWCVQCGYPVGSRVCPECGHELSAVGPRDLAAHRRPAGSGLDPHDP